METIVIENGVVRIEEKSVVKSVSLSAFKSAIRDSVGFRTPILPDNVVLYGQAKEKSAYVIQEAPRKRTIKYKAGARSSTQVSEVTIPLPWVIFVAEFNSFALQDLFVFFRPSRLERANDDIFCAPLMNVYDDGKVCLGNYRFDVTRSLATRINAAAGFFWGSIFNKDITVLYEEKMPQEIQALSDGEDFMAGWQELSEDRVCRIQWHEFGTLEDVLEKILGEEVDEE